MDNRFGSVAMSFEEVISKYSWDDASADVYRTTSRDVERALGVSGQRSINDFMALLSPAAEPYLEEMAQESKRLTKKRFGNIIQMYIPLYLSNECQNICTYCGFSFHNKIPRITLTKERVLKEVEVIKSLGYDHVLLVTGEAQKTVGVDYFEEMLDLIRPHFSHISMEVQPLLEEDYRRLIPHGLNTVLVYQETYNREAYKKHHPKGKKSNYSFRLDTPERLGKAGIHKMGLGALIGLTDRRVDSAFVAMHLSYLQKKFWKTKYSVSFPRLRPAEGVATPEFLMTEKELVQLICAYRLFNENVELSLSTRESEHFRNHAVNVGITSISAGSKTDPGGYANGSHALRQFEISDDRSPQEVAEMLQSQGFEPVWKDWDLALG